MTTGSGPRTGAQFPHALVESAEAHGRSSEHASTARLEQGLLSLAASDVHRAPGREMLRSEPTEQDQFL